ncbi:MAG: chitobiase/beta-hexosaminidase C-terminal domain-containing protein [Chitinivibrionales bacterium]|nr:chitobiase/beta-hexosaminidase C-terminal domain-containing protein [Chitinivibrionales bacterium]
MKQFLHVLTLSMLYASASFGDIEMSITFAKTDVYRGMLKWKNRQTSYVWNNDLLTVAAVGFTHGSIPQNPLEVHKIQTYQLLGKDKDNLTQYRFLYPRSDKVSMLPNEEAIYGTDAKPLEIMLCTLNTDCPYPRYPHVVLRQSPWYGLKNTNTTIYAPPLSADDIDPLSGAVKNQADFYDPKAWFARDNAPLFVDSNHHPTQLWIGTPHILPSSTVEDAKNSADYYTGQFNNSIGATGDGVGHGSYITPNSPTGDGVSYTHAKGSAPGGLMLSLALAFGQEFFGYDLRTALVQGCKESFLCVFNDKSHPNFPEWRYQGMIDGAGAPNTDPYQITDNLRMGIGYQAMPDFYSHSAVYIKGFPTIDAARMKRNIVNATITFFITIHANFYVYLSASRSHRLDELAQQSADPFALYRIIAYAYNQGPNEPNMTIPDMRYGSKRDAYRSSKNLSVTHNMVGGFGYCPKAIDLSRRIGRSSDVYDWGICWGDVDDFLTDLRKGHYVNGFPSDQAWQSMNDELHKAFLLMQGKAPTAGLKPDQISFRYNWLTMLRIMKSYLPGACGSMGKGATLFSNRAPFFGAYVPGYAFSINSDIDQETKPAMPDTNYAPHIYWVAPRYRLPSVEQAFPVVDNQPNSSQYEIAADVLDDGVGGLKTTVRFCVSPGDPLTGGHSLWHDGEKTGSTQKNPQPQDWKEMGDIGPSQNPVGGKRFKAIFDASSIKNEKRRIYIEANDNCGYRTISWVDVYFKDDGLEDLNVLADPPSGTHFHGDTTIALSTKPQDPSVKIFYTADGATPDTTNASQRYSKPFVIAGRTVTVQAIAIGNRFSPGKGTFVYFSDPDQAFIKAFPDSGATFKDAVEVTLSSNAEKIYYTTDGTPPDSTKAAQLYTKPFTVSAPVSIVRGIAVGANFLPATGIWKYYKESSEAWIDATPPSFTHFGDNVTVSLSTNGTKIFYTVNGSTPDTTQSSQLYTAPFTAATDTVTVQAIATGPGLKPGRGTFYYFRDYLPRVIAYPVSGTLFEEQLQVRLELDNGKAWPNARIYYTIDGSYPTEKSRLYSTPITLLTSDTIIAKAFDKNAVASDTTIAIYYQMTAVGDAFYHDRDGNGRIDYATIRLRNATSALPKKIDCTSPFQTTEKISATAAAIEWHQNAPSSQQLDVTLPAAFTFSHATGFQAGLFGLFQSPEYPKEPFSIADKVAPVIDSGWYCPGGIIDISTVKRAPDTLIVAFTEPVQSIAIAQPFRFKTKSAVFYTMKLSTAVILKNRAIFTVDTLIGVSTCLGGDSIWIDERSDIRDDAGNVQNIVNNRHVQLIVKPQPVCVIVKAASPFSVGPSGSTIPAEILSLTGMNSSTKKPVTGTLFTVDFLTNLEGKEKDITCAIIIFDPLGNTVATCSGIDDKNGTVQMGVTTMENGLTRLYIVWNGCSNQSRFCGSGAFMSLLTVTAQPGLMPITKKIMLGIQTQPLVQPRR